VKVELLLSSSLVELQAELSISIAVGQSLVVDMLPSQVEIHSVAASTSTVECLLLGVDTLSPVECLLLVVVLT